MKEGTRLAGLQLFGLCCRWPSKGRETQLFGIQSEVIRSLVIRCLGRKMAPAVGLV